MKKTLFVVKPARTDVFVWCELSKRHLLYTRTLRRNGNIPRRERLQNEGILEFVEEEIFDPF